MGLRVYLSLSLYQFNPTPEVEEAEQPVFDHTIAAKDPVCVYVIYAREHMCTETDIHSVVRPKMHKSHSSRMRSAQRVVKSLEFPSGTND